MIAGAGESARSGRRRSTLWNGRASPPTIATHGPSAACPVELSCAPRERRAGEGVRAGSAIARGGEGQRLRAWPHARSSGAGGCRRPGARRARHRDRVARSRSMRSASCCSKVSSRADELPEIAARRIAVVVHSEAQLRMLERSRLAKPVEVFIKINTGMNRLGFAPSDVVRSGRAPQQLRIRRRAAADDALRPRRRGLRHRGTARASSMPRAGACRIRARSPIPPAWCATAKSAARSSARASCSTVRRRTPPTRRSPSACGR